MLLPEASEDPAWAVERVPLASCPAALSSPAVPCASEAVPWTRLFVLALSRPPASLRAWAAADTRAEPRASPPAPSAS